MKLKAYFLFMVNLAVSSVFSNPTVNPDVINAEVEIGDVGENMRLSDDLLLDDIRRPQTRSTIIDETILWTSPVSYVLDKSLDLNAKGVIVRALDQFRVKSCINFKVWDSEEYYLNIQKLTGCWSFIGRTMANGQDLSIGAGCDLISIVEHEILHALGFYHEQSRFDRDDHIQVLFNNILEGQERNFDKVSSDISTTHGTPYDYWSVMHYNKNTFTNGNGPTIMTINPIFQDVIGQQLDMSPLDAKELNLLYSCKSSVAFRLYCGFSNGTMCKMDQCSQSGNGFEVVTQVNRGPSSDHTSLPSGKGDIGQEVGYFIHASTASGQEGDSARLETQILSLNRGCNVQCLQFYYFHSGNEFDQLNIWIREFQDEQDTTGTIRLVDQITGSPTSHWKLHHVSLNATKQFQVVFEVRKGAGSSTGGFSIDDINLSETQCPHVTLQIDDFEELLNTSASGTIIYSPRQYSKEGYAFRVAVILYQTRVGFFVQLLSGDFDDQLEWPCLRRQMNFQLLDQNPNIQQQMSLQRNFVSVETQVTPNGTIVWSNPRETGRVVFSENGELVYGGPLRGFTAFADSKDLQSRDVLKGGSAIFIFNFEDLTPLVNGSALPCPQVRSVNIENPPSILEGGPCSPRISTTTSPHPQTDKIRTSTTISPPPTTTGHRISTTTSPPPTTTNKSRISTTTSPPPTTTDKSRISTTISPPPTTTDERRISTTISPPPKTTDDSSTIIISTPPKTTEDKSVFGFAPAAVSSPFLFLLLTLLLLVQ